VNIKFEAEGDGVVRVYENGQACGLVRVSDDQEFVRIVTEGLQSVEVNMVMEDVTGVVTGVSIDQLGGRS
jgi:hypothetical protein